MYPTLSIFNFSNLTSFVVGIVFGMMLLLGIYVIIVLRTMNSDMHVTKATGDLSKEEALEKIDSAKKKFKDKKLQAKKGNVEYAREIVEDLTYSIASAFFPDSDTPFFELTVDEILFLNHYVTKRVEELLGRRGLRIFKKYRVTQILGMIKKKTAIQNSKLLKTAEKHKVTSRSKKILGVVNLINPVYWVKKAVVNVSMNIIIRKICILVIVIVGEETYKIYGKHVFNEIRDIDAGVDEIVSNIKEDLE